MYSKENGKIHSQSINCNSMVLTAMTQLLLFSSLANFLILVISVPEFPKLLDLESRLNSLLKPLHRTPVLMKITLEAINPGAVGISKPRKLHLLCPISAWD